MVGDTQGNDLAEVIEKRRYVLAALLDAPREKRALVEDLDVSRSTVDRAVRDLERHRLVTRGPKGLEPTLAGRLAAEAHGRYLDELAGIARAEEVLSYLSPTAPLPVEALADADVLAPDQNAPYHPLKRMLTLIESAGRLRVFVTADAAAEVFDVCHRRVRSGADAECIADPRAVAHLEDVHGDRLEYLMETSDVSLYEHAGLPFCLGIVDDGDTRVGIVVHTDQGGLAGALVMDSDAAVEWADALFERYRGQATPLTS